MIAGATLFDCFCVLSCIYVVSHCRLLKNRISCQNFNCIYYIYIYIYIWKVIFLENDIFHIGGIVWKWKASVHDVDVKLSLHYFKKHNGYLLLIFTPLFVVFKA